MKKQRASFFSNILNYVVIIGLIIFISFLFPYQRGIQYDFEIGQPWPYDQIKADNSFGILKSDQQLQSERDARKKEFLPYFTRDTVTIRSLQQTVQQQLNQLHEETTRNTDYSDFSSRKDKYLRLAHSIIRIIYAQGGVMSASAMEEYVADRKAINLIQGNENRIVARSQLYSPASAKRTIISELKKSDLPDADLLLPTLLDQLTINLKYDQDRTERFLEMELAQISDSEGVVEKGEVIVTKGQIVSADLAKKIHSYEEQYQQDQSGRFGNWWVFFGYLLLTIALITIFLLYLQLNASEVYARFNNLLFMVIWVAVYSYLVSAIDPITNISLYIIPFCIVPIVIKNFFNDRIALFVHIIIILLASYLSSYGYEFIFIEMFAGIATLLSLRLNKTWNRLFSTIAIIFGSYVIAYTGLSLIREGSFQQIHYMYFLWFFLSAFLTFLAYPLLPILEKVFGFTSEITLRELTDMNHPLLRKLSVEAPGTLQHSLQVANLCEAAADAIGANSLLVKVAALYHDVGKSAQPEFFIENQSGDNPHEQITDLESAKIIINHVPAGAEMARKNKLPKKIIDFIWTHHGTTRVEYFYRNHKTAYPKEYVDESLFRYPGPKPQTKEQAIMMLADSLEASCKSLKNPTGVELDEMIDKIIQSKIDQKQFIDCELSFQDLEVCRAVCKKMLRSIHHVRVEYPKEEE